MVFGGVCVLWDLFAVDFGVGVYHDLLCLIFGFLEILVFWVYNCSCR